jgi:hypothetical protein
MTEFGRYLLFEVSHFNEHLSPSGSATLWVQFLKGFALRAKQVPCWDNSHLKGQPDEEAEGKNLPQKECLQG